MTKYITTYEYGTVLSDGGAVRVTSTGAIFGEPTGVAALTFDMTYLSNEGQINGETGPTGAGGVGVLNERTITTFNNAAKINGGQGGVGNGGAAIRNAGAITALANTGVIDGGEANQNPTAALELGGAGIDNTGTIGAKGEEADVLRNLGYIEGGFTWTGVGGAGVRNTGLITTLSNRKTIIGGYNHTGRAGDGVDNSAGVIALVANASYIVGGSSETLGGDGVRNAVGSGLGWLLNGRSGFIIGGYAEQQTPPSTGGVGVENAGLLKLLTNRGAIEGGPGGADDGNNSDGGVGGKAILNDATGLIKVLTNYAGATIVGGAGGSAEYLGSNGAGGAGGVGFTNAGQITTLTNAGTIRGGDGGPSFTTPGAGGVGLVNTGTIATFHNTGTIGNGAPGAAILSAGLIGAFDNSGRIDGGVWLGHGGVTMRNAGAIAGDLTFVGAGDTVENSGEIGGDLTLGADDNLTDVGEIQGRVVMGFADKLYLGQGAKVGEIAASSRDLFAIDARAGDVTIYGFVTGDGAEHDTLVLSASLLGGAAQGFADTTQVGADVVIRLDGSDSIRLAGVSLGKLTGADLKIA